MTLFALSRDDAATLLEVLVDVAGDDPQALRARRAAFEDTWRRAARGMAVTGAANIARLADDKAIVGKLYTLLADGPEIQAVDEFVARFVIWQGPGVVIDREMIAQDMTRPYMTRTQFIRSYGHMFAEIGGKPRLLPEMLFSMDATTRVQGVTFQPGGPEIIQAGDGDRLNHWSGFAIPPYDGEVSQYEVGKFLAYLYLVLAAKNDAHYEWLLAWIADIFQHPAQKPGTALVLVGTTGIGKTFLGEHILGPIIGEKHYVQTNSVEALTGNFNAPFGNKLLIQCDEAINPRQRAVAARLKSLITDKVQRIEPKGIDAHFVPNHARLLFTTNEEDAIFLNQGYDDRRYTVLEPSACEKGNVKEYWLPFLAWLAKPETLPRIHRHLLDHEYDKTLIRAPLQTEAKERMQQRNWDPFEAWVAEMLSRNHPLSEAAHEHWSDAPLLVEQGWNQMIDRSAWPEWLSPEALARDYRLFLKADHWRTTAAMPSALIMRALRQRGLYPDGGVTRRVQFTTEDPRTKRLRKHRVRLVRCLDRAAVAEHMLRRHGFRVDEGSADQTDEIDEW